MNNFTAPTTYFLEEGRQNLDECLRVSFQAAKLQSIRTIVIFTAKGDGVNKAIEEYRVRPDYAHIQLIAVSFPAGKVVKGADDQPMTVEIGIENRQRFAREGIPIVTAHFPFDGLKPAPMHSTPVGHDMALIASALNMFSGSMSLCVQAVTMACDAGHIGIGDHVIAMTADTSILARATVTRNMLSDLIIREVLCKPAIMTIARSELNPSEAGREEKVLNSKPLHARRKKLKSKMHQKSKRGNTIPYRRGN
jgi:hypothetical protein